MKKDPRYGTQRWRRLRTQALARYGRRCAVLGCGSNMALPGMTHVDHIDEAVDGAWFWSLGNLQVLCKLHHDEKSAAVRARRKGGKEPVSPNA